MNDFVVRGNKNLWLIDVATSWDNRNGGTTTYTYTCQTATEANVCPADLTALALQLITNGWSTQITQNKTGPRWTLVATYPVDLITDPMGTRIPDIQWDIEPYETEQNLLECNDRQFISGLSTTTKTMIENALKYPTGTMPLTQPNETKQYASALTAYRLRVQGTEAREVDSIIIKRTLVVPKWYSPQWLLTYNGKILSKNFLVKNYYVPAWVSAGIPNSDGSIQKDVNGITTFWGYREYKPERRNISFNRVEWHQLWKYNKWSAGDNGLYDIVS